ncbi:hypothetical protein H0O03_04085 [Candidatus Micrarchaeota archaeon]|nr:hypothetical protein [Candidatus Micrarchaeota archaeon]
MEPAKPAEAALAKREPAKFNKPLVMTKVTIKGTQKAVERHLAMAEESEKKANFIHGNKNHFIHNWTKDLTARVIKESPEKKRLFEATKHHVISQAHLVDPSTAKSLVEKAITNYQEEAKLHRSYAQAYTRGLELKLRKKQARGAWFKKIWTKIRR